MKRHPKKVLNRTIIAFAIVLISAGTYIQILAPRTLEARQRLQLESTQDQLIKTRERLNDSQESSESKEKQLEELNKKLEDTQKELQAKRSSGTAYAAVSTKSTKTITGNKETWLLASGIPKESWGYVDSIVSRESGWNPCAYNPGKSDCYANPKSACGLAQSLPCGKQSKYGHWTDPVANLKWQYEYVTSRYGGYAQAVAFWNKNHWY